MATFNSDPVFPTPTTAAYVPYPSGAPADLPTALVVNSTPYVLIVSQGGLQLGYLPAGITNVYQLSSQGTPLNFAVPPGQTTQSQGGAVYVSWSDASFGTSFPTGGPPVVNLAAGATLNISGGTIDVNNAPGSTITMSADQSHISTIVAPADNALHQNSFVIPDDTAAILLEVSGTSAPGMLITVYDGPNTAGPVIYQEWPWANFAITAGPNNTLRWVFPCSSATFGGITVTFQQTGTAVTTNIHLTAITGSVPPSSPPEAIAQFAGGANGGAPGVDPFGRLYEVSYIGLADTVSSDASGVFTGAGPTGGQLVCPLGDAINFIPPLVVPALHVQFTGGTPTGTYTLGVAYRFH